MVGQEVSGHTGSAVNEQQDRVIDVFPPDKHPLLHTVDVDVKLLGKPAGERMSGFVVKRLRSSRTEQPQ